MTAFSIYQFKCTSCLQPDSNFPTYLTWITFCRQTTTAAMMEHTSQDFRDVEEEKKTDNTSNAMLVLGGTTTNASIAVATFEEQNFSFFSVLGIGYSVTNSAMAILASLATAIGSGGPVSLIWGQIGIFFIALCFAVTLGQFSSAMPNAAGQSYWVGRLAPDRVRRLLAFNTGFLAWASSICIVASGTLLLPQMAIGIYMLERPNFVYQPWMGLVGFQLTNFTIFFLNTVSRFLPTISRASMLWSMLSLVIIFISMLAASPAKQSASFVFTDFINLSGWKDPVAFMTGIIGVNWGYSCLDACCHIAEEVPNPERNIPKVLLATVIVGFLTAFPLTIAALFSMGDIVEVITTRTMVPSLQLFLQVFSGNTAGAAALQSLIIVVFAGSIFGAHTWQSRLCWTFARQGGLPFQKQFGSIAPKPFGVPIAAHLLSCCMVSVLGFLYLGSTTAFNAFVGAALHLQNLSYSICVICLFIHGRSNLAHGPFWFPKLGAFCQCVVIFWTLYSLVMYSFPPAYPTTVTTMNYASVVLVAIIVLINIGWVSYGRKTFIC